jgi:hypothetical protein
MSEKNGKAPKLTLGSLISAPSKKKIAKYHWLNEAFADLWPATFEFLAAAYDDEENPRVGGSLIIFAESDRLKVCLVDKHTGQKAFLTFNADLPNFDQIEAALMSGAEWRAKDQRNAGTPVF